MGGGGGLQYNVVMPSLPYLPQFSDTTNSTPIKLHTTANPVYPRAQHHGCPPWKFKVIFTGIVGQVQVIGESRILCSDSVNLFDIWSDGHGLPSHPHSKLSAKDKVKCCTKNCCTIIIVYH